MSILALSEPKSFSSRHALLFPTALGVPLVVWGVAMLLLAIAAHIDMPVIAFETHEEPLVRGIHTMRKPILKTISTPRKAIA